MSEINVKYPELTELLRTFTRQVLIDKPTDILAFSVDYFSHLKFQRDLYNEDLNDNDEDDDEVDSEIGIMTDRESKRKMQQTSNIPRKSIIGERFDPASIDDETFERNRHIFVKSNEQLEKISQILSSIFLFNTLEEDQLKRVIESMFPVEVVAGEVIIKEKDPGDNFYVIDHGTFTAYNKNDTIQQEYVDEGSFGELALMYNCPRVATVAAKTNGLLWAMDRTSFRQLILKGAYNKRKRLENLLKSIPILNELSEYDRCNLADALKTLTFHNTTIVKQGELGDKMYFIEEGEAAVIYTNEKGEEREERRLLAGEYFGEVALIANIPRIASVQAIGTIKVAELDVKSYNRLMGPCIDMMRENFSNYRATLEQILTGEQLKNLFPEFVELPKVVAEEPIVVALDAPVVALDAQAVALDAKVVALDAKAVALDAQAEALKTPEEI